MPETKRGGARPGAGRKPGSPNKPSATRALLALVKAQEIAIEKGDFAQARDYCQKLDYILSFIPQQPSPSE